MHLPTLNRLFLSSVYETTARKKDTNTKLLKGNWLLDMTKYFLYSSILRANTLPIYSLIYTFTFILIN